MLRRKVRQPPEPAHEGRRTPPSDLIELGAVRGAHGIRGWVRVVPYSADAEVLRSNRSWWLQRDGAAEQIEVTGLRRHAGQLLAKWSGCETPEAAEALRGATVGVARSDFPAPPQGMYYWADLVGAKVVNRAGEELGRVRGLSNNGAQDLLEVVEDETVRLVPMIATYVDRIDVDAKTITVDWQRDW
ncbi:MAG: ribosome maturation factor RimM [Gemmatimonadota bacterium]